MGEEDLGYEIDSLEEKVKKAIDKMVQKGKKSDLDGILTRLINIEYTIIIAKRKLIKEDKYFQNKAKDATDLYKIYKKARFASTSLDEIKSTVESCTEKYLSSSWMYTPIITNALIMFLIDIELTALQPTTKENIREALFICSFMAGLMILFFFLSRYDFHWSHYQILGWFKVNTLLSAMSGICAGIFILTLGYPISLISGHRKFVTHIKKSEPILATKRDVLKGSYDGRALSKRLSLVEENGVYPNSEIYSLLQTVKKGQM